MVGLELPAGDLARPVERAVEREHLRRRQDPVVVALEELAHGLVPLRAHERSRRHVVGAQLRAVLDLEDRLGLHVRAQRRALVGVQETRPDLPGAQREPGAPDRIDREVGVRFLHDAAHVREGRERGAARLEHARFERQGALHVARPRDARAREVAREIEGLELEVAIERQRDARVVAGLHAEEQRQVGDAARHRAEHAHRRQPQVARVRRHAADAGPQREHVVPTGGVAQAAAVVAAIGDGQHAQRQCDRGAAATAAGAARRVVGVTGGAVHLVVGVRAQAEFRRVRAADEDRARAAHALDHDAVGRGDEAAQRDEPTQRRLHAPDRLEVLDRLWEAVQRAAALAARELGVARARLGEKLLALAQRDDRVHVRVDARDVVERRVHDLDTRDASSANGRRESHRVHRDDRVHGSLRARCESVSRAHPSAFLAGQRTLR